MHVLAFRSAGLGILATATTMAQRIPSPGPGAAVMATPIAISPTARGAQAWDVSFNPNSGPGLTNAIDIVGGELNAFGQWEAVRWQYTPGTGAITMASLHPTGMKASGGLAARFEEFGGFTLVPNSAVKAPPPLVWQATHWVGNAVNAYPPYWAGNSWEYSIVTDMGTGTMGGWQHQIPNNAVNRAIPWMLWRLNPAWIWTNPAPMKNWRACYWSPGGGAATDLHPISTPGGGSRVLGVSGDGQMQAGDIHLVGAPGVHACFWQNTQASWVDLHPTNATSPPLPPAYLHSVAYDVHGGFGNQIQVGSIINNQATRARRAGYWTGTAASWKSLHPAGTSNYGSEAWSGDGYIVGFVRKTSSNGRTYGMIFDTSTTPAHLQLPDPPGSWGYTFATSSTFLGPECAYIVGYGLNNTSGREEPILWTISAPTTPCYADCDHDGVITLLDQACFANLYNAGNPAADCNGDGTLTPEDLICFDKVMLDPCNSCGCTFHLPCDCDADGAVTINDFVCHVTALSNLINLGAYDPAYDCNCDGVLDVADETCLWMVWNSGQYFNLCIP